MWLPRTPYIHRECSRPCPAPAFTPHPPQLQCIYAPGEWQPPGSSTDLKAALTQLFSYASGGGFEDDPTTAPADTTTGMAGAGAGVGTA